MQYIKVTILFSFFITLLSLTAYAEPGKRTTGVVLLPFDAQNSGTYGVLKDGLRNMIASRLAAQEGVIVLENSLSSEEQEGFSTLSQPEKGEIFKTLAADYIAVGKMLAQDRVFLLQLDFYQEKSDKPASVTMHAQFC